MASHILVSLFACLACLGCSGILGSSDLPEPVTDLSALVTSSSSVALTWTAPTGKEGRNIRLGSYEVRYSLTIMATRDDWTAGTVIANVQPPSDPGEREIVKVAQLTPGKRYYFGVRSVSSSGDRSDRIDETSASLPFQDITSPGFAAADFNDSVHSSLEWIGQVPVLLNFWASWCGPCHTEMPELIALYDDIAPLGVEILGMASSSEYQEAKNFIAQYQPGWPQLIATRDVVSDWHVGGYPTTIFVKADGSVFGIMVGSHSEEQFRITVDLMLQDSTSATPLNEQTGFSYSDTYRAL